jgi:hypothetical protein
VLGKTELDKRLSKRLAYPHISHALPITNRRYSRLEICVTLIWRDKFTWGWLDLEVAIIIAAIEQVFVRGLGREINGGFAGFGRSRSEAPGGNGPVH